MLAALVLALAAVASPAQTCEKAAEGKPPEEVDRALRARIAEFNDLQVKGQYRKAEAFVAEDTKDLYYQMGKPKYKSLTLLSIEYCADFTRANALVACEQYINAPPYPLDVPLTGRFISMWKVVDGEWYYYDDLAARKTPLGNLFTSATPPAGMSGVPGVPGSPPPAGMPVIPATVEAFLHGLKADRDSVSIKPGETAKVTITNSAPGPMGLAIDSTPPGVEAKIDKADVPAGGESVLTIAAGKNAKPGTIAMHVVQTTARIEIQLNLK